MKKKNIKALTITISEECHRALQGAAEREQKSIAAIIEECLDTAGVYSDETAAGIVAQARSKAGLTDAEALAVAVEETRVHRIRQ